MRKLTGLSLAAIGGLVASLLQLPPAVAQAPEAEARSITWAPCAEDPAVDCGTLTLPIDWENPTGPTFELAVARRKATNPSTRIGSLVFQLGGPGEPGVVGTIYNWYSFSGDLTSRFDIVGFDPRGVGRSSPIVCSTDVLFRDPGFLMESQADFDAALAYNKERRDDCRAKTGPIYDHVDTLSVARDLEALRAALGDDKLTYYGASYGTLIAQMYAERYPRKVRALMLDANIDHSLDTRRMTGESAWAVEDSFNAFVAWCDKSAECALNGKDVRAVWRDLLAKAERGELTRPGDPTSRISKLELIYEVWGAGYGPTWARLATTLAAYADGTGTPASALMSLKTSADTLPYPMEIFCQDYRLPIRDYRHYAGLMRRSESIAPNVKFNPLGFGTTVSCLGYPPVKYPQRPVRVNGTPPLLLTSTLHDPATPLIWSESVARQIGSEARLVTYEGAGHGGYTRGPCMRDAADRYFISLTAPRNGTRCADTAADTARVAKTQVASPRRMPAGPLPGLPGVTFRS
ncbi:alpha/beta hydrolase [Sinosporangium siamense]|uniref:Peptidase n=1 Tax=Sinosporangium siamense TaxID=1367973 RepID=A0A919RJ77_9ACTN|nr:alpha/beta hydrolase [Sinosporangium siamense]GII94851.1 peptidase [Sinosporangium siamense]